MPAPHFPRGRVPSVPSAMASAQASPSLSSASLMERFDQLQALLDQKLEGVGA